MPPSIDKIDLIIGAQYDANIDPAKGVNNRHAVLLAQLWLTGAITLYEMRVGYRNLSEIALDLCFTPNESDALLRTRQNRK